MLIIKYFVILSILNSKSMLNYNKTNFLDLLLDNNKKNISSERLINTKKKSN